MAEGCGLKNKHLSELATVRKCLSEEKISIDRERLNIIGREAFKNSLETHLRVMSECKNDMAAAKTRNAHLTKEWRKVKARDKESVKLVADWVTMFNKPENIKTLETYFAQLKESSKGIEKDYVSRETTGNFVKCLCTQLILNLDGELLSEKDMESESKEEVSEKEESKEETNNLEESIEWVCME